MSIKADNHIFVGEPIPALLEGFISSIIALESGITVVLALVELVLATIANTTTKTAAVITAPVTIRAICQATSPSAEVESDEGNEAI